MASLEHAPLTPEQYLDRERSAFYKSEYLCGEIFAMTVASYEHNLLVANVLGEMRTALRGSSCRAVANALRVQVKKAGMFTYPDAFIVCGERHFSDEYLDTLLNPTVAVKVLSPYTELYNRGEKFAHYRRLASLTDYVLVAQNQMCVEHYARQGEQWVLTVCEDPMQTLALASIGCVLSLASIYENVDFVPPSVPAETHDI